MMETIKVIASHPGLLFTVAGFLAGIGFHYLQKRHGQSWKAKFLPMGIVLVAISLAFLGANKEINQTQAAADKQAAKIESATLQVRSDLEERKREIGSLIAKLADAEQAEKFAVATRSKIQVQLASAKGDIDDLRRKLDEAQAKEEEAVSARRSIQRELDDARAREEAAVDARRAIQKELEDARDRNEALSIDNAALGALVDDLREKVRAGNETSDVTRESVERMESHLREEAKNRERELLKSEYDEWCKRNDLLPYYENAPFTSGGCNCGKYVTERSSTSSGGLFC